MKMIQKRKKTIAFSLALVLALLQLSPLNGQGELQQSRKAEAASLPEDTSAITASGAAVAVDPLIQMSQVVVEAQTTSSFSVSWGEVLNATSYNIYRYDDLTEQYIFVANTKKTSYDFTGLPAGEEWYITITAYNEIYGCRSEFSVPVKAYTRPEKLADFTFTGNTATNITLKWNDVESATGYLIYRAVEGGEYTLAGMTDKKQFTDSGLSAGKTYTYKVVTYSLVVSNTGEESAALSMTTLPSAPTIKVKGGTERTRISWSAVTGASGYTIYAEQDGQYIPLIVLADSAATSYIHTGLTNGTEYKYKVTAYRTFEGINYESAASKEVGAKAVEVAATSTTAKYYKSQKAYKKSDAYKNCKTLKKAKYNKSIVMPGMLNTNVAEFGCTSMVPQGITFVKSYLLMTAYDKNKVENSVIYVINKSSKKLVTTIILPNKAHAGGIAFDGKNLWITQAETLRSIPYSQVEEGIKKKEKYIEVTKYATKETLTHRAATITYYEGILWVSSYNELKAGVLGSYQINNKSTKPELVLCQTIKMPTRVQGIEFTEDGLLLVSRSCQTDPKKRGFYHRLDVYKPNLEYVEDGEITLGKVRNYFDMPSMNEEIAISGNYLYVNYESVAFSSAVNPMDRISAFPLSYVTKLKKKA